MKKTLLPLFASAGILATIIGCETEALSQHSLEITPNSANLSINESITLTASGGWNYKWSLSDNTAGNLSRLTGQRVVYTATKEGVTQTVSVTGNGEAPGSGSSSSNQTASAVFSASATIVQGAASGTELSVSGNTYASPGGSPVILTASGGDGVNYTWSLHSPDIGSLNRNTGKEVAYTAKAGTENAAQQITVKSGKSETTKVITHTNSDTNKGIRLYNSTNAD